MGVCKIQKPTNKTSQRGKIIAQITHNEITSDEVEFDATKGDLRLHFICEEEQENSSFYIGKNNDEAIKELTEKIEKMQLQISDLYSRIL